MKLAEIIKLLPLQMKAGGSSDKEVNGCYVSDMLSDVLSNSKDGNLWITRQTHPNIIGVASVKELSGIIISGNKEIEPETLSKANEENIAVMVTPLLTFEVAGALYNLFSKRA